MEKRDIYLILVSSVHRSVQILINWLILLVSIVVIVLLTVVLIGLIVEPCVIRLPDFAPI